MGYSRGRNFESKPLNIVGSSVYAIYEKQDSEHTFNMTISDNWLVPYPGYKIGIKFEEFEDAERGRGLYQSVRLNKMFAVYDQNVYKIEVQYDHIGRKLIRQDVIKIGSLDTTRGPVFFAENNKPQILISDSTKLYIYDPSLIGGTFLMTTPTTDTLNFNKEITFTVGEPVELIEGSGGTVPTNLAENITYYVTNPILGAGTTSIQLSTSPLNAVNGTVIAFPAPGLYVAPVSVITFGSFQDIPTDFTPGYISFHDTYFLVAAKVDKIYTPPAQNSWRLSGQNNGFVWPSDAQHVGLLESKSDITQAVTRFPSRGNMILVMGKAVTEFWFDTGNQLFPYQRQNQSSIDYGCVNPATVASLDEIVIWLGQNEKSGPIVMYTTGAEPKKITTDGIDFKLSQINTPEDSEGFLFRKNGHLFYHLNFYTEGFSFVFDLTLNKIYDVSDQNLSYYIMGQVVWYQNQYFSISQNTGNLYIFDTVFNTYEDTDALGNVIEHEIPRIRICANTRLPSQDYFVINDIGFTIETGETDYIYQNQGTLFLTTEDDNRIETEDATLIFLLFENDNIWQTEGGANVASEQNAAGQSSVLISNQDNLVPVTPRVDFSISYDGGAAFSADFPYVLHPTGKRRNRLMWWNLGMANDVVCQFKFWNVGAVVCENGVMNIRT